MKPSDSIRLTPHWGLVSQDLRRPIAHIMLVAITALAIRNFQIWSQVRWDDVVHLRFSLPWRREPVGRMWPTLPRLQVQPPPPRRTYTAGLYSL
jgi:hypothetical protein